MDESAPQVDAAVSPEFPAALPYPGSAEGYEIRLPENTDVEGGDAVLDSNDPRMALVRNFAHANKLTQNQFEDLLAIGVNADLAEQAAINEALKAEVEALGAKATERVRAVIDWLGAKLGGEAAAALVPMLMTAKQVQAFERLMQLNRGAVPGNPGAGREPGTSEMSDAEYDSLSSVEKLAYARRHSGR